MWLSSERAVRYFILIPIFLAFAFLELFIGGARLLYAVPGVLMIALASLASVLPKFKTSQRANIAALIGTASFSLYVLLRNRFSEVEYIARLQFFIMAGCLLVYLLFTLVLTKPADRKLLFGFLMILALIQLVPAIIQFTQEDSWMPLSWAQRRDVSWRASGFFISPNHFAGFLEIIALMAASFSLWGRAKITTRVLTGYITVACILGIAISGSRGGYLSLLFGSVILLLLSLIAWKRMERERFLLVAGISAGTALLLFLGTLLMFFLSPHIGERVIGINDPENMRLLLWRSAFQQFQLSPIWGTGGFSFLYYGRFFRDPSVQNDPIHVHDDYLQLLADYGLVGMGLFLLFLFLHVRAGVSSFIKLTASSADSRDFESDRLALNIGALAVVGAYLVHSVVDFNMQLPLNALLMAVILAVLVNPGAPKEESLPADTSVKFRKLLRYALPAGGLALMIYGIPMIRGEYLAERARIALRDGHPREALEWARKGTMKTHDNPELYFYRGEAALETSSLGSYGESSPPDLRLEAVGSFSSGLHLFPYDSRLALKLAQAQAAYGDYFSAISTINYAERLDPNSAFIPAYRGLIESSFGFNEEARLAYQQANDLGGSATSISQAGLDLLDKQDKLVSQPRRETLPSPGQATHSEPDVNGEAPHKSSPSSDESDASGALMNAAPAAKSK